MEKDKQKIILINKLIPQDALSSTTLLTKYHTLSLDLSNYKHINSILEQHHNNINILEIYDITYCAKLSYGDVIAVSDHINRIGHNPFIGQQKTFRIDFIDISTLYYPRSNGVTTNSLGDAFPSPINDSCRIFLESQAIADEWSYPSTFLANVATLGHIYNYSIKAQLINIKL